MKKEQNVQCINRECANISATNRIVSSSSDEIIIDTKQGLLEISGSDLNIQSFDTNSQTIIIMGKINAFNYKS